MSIDININIDIDIELHELHMHLLVLCEATPQRPRPHRLPVNTTNSIVGNLCMLGALMPKVSGKIVVCRRASSCVTRAARVQHGRL